MQKRVNLNFWYIVFGQINFLLHQLGIHLDGMLKRANRCRSCAAVTVQSWLSWYLIFSNEMIMWQFSLTIRNR